MKNSAWLLVGVMAFGLAAPALAQPLEPKFTYIVRDPWVWNRADDGIYTLLGIEKLGGTGLVQSGWGFVAGLNQGVMNQTATLGYGGKVFLKDFNWGRLTLSPGLLLGFGWIGAITPSFGFSGVYGFGVTEPRLTVSWAFTERLAVGMGVSYLFTSNPSVATGPALLIKLSGVAWD